MDDDFNTALAIGKLFEFVKEVNKSASTTDKSSDEEKLNELNSVCMEIFKAGKILGILEHSPDEWFKIIRAADSSKSLSEEEIQKLITERNEARKQKDWSSADRIRNELKDKGIILKDGPQGTTWKSA